MSHFTGVFGLVVLWDLHLVSYLVRVVVIWSDAGGLHAVFFGENAAVPFDLQDGIWKGETRGQARQNDVCLNVGVLLLHVDLRWSCKEKA